MSIEDKIPCGHPVLISRGIQERPGNEPIELGDCLYCLSTISARKYFDVGNASVELEGKVKVGRLYIKKKDIEWEIEKSVLYSRPSRFLDE